MTHILFDDFMEILEEDLSPEVRESFLKAFEQIKGFLLYIPKKPFEYRLQRQKIKELKRLGTPLSEMIRILATDSGRTQHTIRRRLKDIETRSLFDDIE